MSEITATEPEAVAETQPLDCKNEEPQEQHNTGNTEVAIQDGNGEVNASVENPSAEIQAEDAQEKRMSAPFKCNLCDEEIQTMKAADEHINGKPHRRKMELHFIEKCVKKEKCELCGTQFTSLTQVFDHLSGFEHASNTVAARKPKSFAAPGRGARGAIGVRGGPGSRGRGMQNGAPVGGLGRGLQRGSRGGLPTRGGQRGAVRGAPRGGSRGIGPLGAPRGGQQRGRGGRGGGKMPVRGSNLNRPTPYGTGKSFMGRGRGRMNDYQVGSSLGQTWMSGYSSSFSDDSLGEFGPTVFGEFSGSFRDAWYSGVDDGADSFLQPPPLPPF